MKRILILTVLLTVLFLPGCGGRPPSLPDLTGEWITVGKDGTVDPESTDYYQMATVTEDSIEVFWFTARDGSTDLYWSGSYVPPGPGDREPYAWESVNNPERTETTRFALRDATKTFAYRDGTILYNVMMGHMKMAMNLERRTVPDTE